MEKIAILGLGRMGHGMAFRLIENGFKVLVWNRSRGKETDLIKRGACWAESPAAAAREASVIICMLADDDASRAVLLGEYGAFAQMKPDSFIIECSTLSFDHVNFISVEAKKRGIIYIDCPVTGMPSAAAEGKLTLLVGADPVHLEAIRPVLSSFSNTIRYFGPIGSGTAYKLMINLMGAVQIAALAEGLAMADKFGLDKKTVIEAVEHSAAASPQVIRNLYKMAAANFNHEPAFTVRLRYKDAAYGLALAEKIKSHTPVGEAAFGWFAAAKKENADADEAAVLNVINSSPG
ncbi:MAG: NAD(P)-dependent oxidoreductase [Bacteroidota bacterium]|nr:NAD(P)-dependent oxidoreductase [Bacteroidota bacterium]MDP4248532.1 NAD(P)-dependent oxidoreductase [Bacteroidota bacterium]